jgi:hypothetical protein
MRARGRISTWIIAAMLVLASCASDDPAPPVPTTAEPTTTTASHAVIEVDERRVLDAEWSSPETGLVLLVDPCDREAGCIRVLRTVDGGTTFDALPGPKADADVFEAGHGISAACPDERCVGGLLVETTGHAFAWGPGLFETSDGAATWSSVPSDPVLQLVRSGAWTVKVTLTCPDELDPSVLDCSQAVEIAQIGSSGWVPLPSPGTWGTSADLAVTPDGMVTLLGTDRGVSPRLVQIQLPGGHWSAIESPECNVSEVSSAPTATAPTLLLCVTARGARAADGADTAIWALGSRAGREVVTLGDPPGGVDALVTFDEDHQMFCDDGTVRMSSDAGVTWQTTLIPNPDEYVSPGCRFTVIDERAATLVYGDGLWSTSDAGETWRKLELPGPWGNSESLR